MTDDVLEEHFASCFSAWFVVCFPLFLESNRSTRYIIDERVEQMAGPSMLRHDNPSIRTMSRESQPYATMIPPDDRNNKYRIEQNALPMSGSAE